MVIKAWMMCQISAMHMRSNGVHSNTQHIVPCHPLEDTRFRLSREPSAFVNVFMTLLSGAGPLHMHPADSSDAFVLVGLRAYIWTSCLAMPIPTPVPTSHTS